MQRGELLLTHFNNADKAWFIFRALKSCYLWQNQNENMRYERIKKDLFIKNRAKLASLMAPGSLAIFNSNDIYPTSSDGTLSFKQHSDIFYLSGVDQEESILVVFPDSKDPALREILFLKETNETIALWEGEKLTKEAAFDTAGIQTVYWLDQVDTILSNELNVFD